MKRLIMRTALAAFCILLTTQTVSAAQLLIPGGQVIGLQLQDGRVCVDGFDPELGDARVPNFILQPIVENSLLHGLKNKGYSGVIRIATIQKDKKHFEIQVSDTGSGFAEGKKEAVEQLLKNYAKRAPKLTGNSIGILNVQKRIKLLCGKDCGLSYTENEWGGLTAHLLLSLEE